MSKLSISVEDRKTSGFAARPYTMIRLQGFIDAPNYLDFEGALEKQARAKKKYLVLDFTGVEYINSTGISAIIRFHSQLKDLGGELIWIQVSRNVGLTMHLLGVTTLVSFMKTLKEAEEVLEGETKTSEFVDDAQSRFDATDVAEGSESRSPVFVDASRVGPSGTVIVAVPKTGAFSRIFHQRVTRLEGTYHLVHSVEGLNETIARWNPDLIVLDHRLPGADSFVEKLKIDTGFSMVSLIVLYEKGVDIFRHQEFRIWENDFLVDPFDMMNLFMLAESELRRVPRDKQLFNQQVKFQFDSQRSAIDRGLLLADKLIQSLELPEAETTALYAAIKEAVDNAVLHGNRHDPKKTVSINFISDPNKVTFIIEDEGEGFDYDYYVSQLGSQEAFDRAKERIRDGGRGGLGILLMHKCSDRLEYSGSGSTVRVEKNFSEM